MDAGDVVSSRSDGEGKGTAGGSGRGPLMRHGDEAVRAAGGLGSFFSPDGDHGIVASDCFASVMSAPRTPEPESWYGEQRWLAT